MEVVNPSVMLSRLDLVVLDSVVAGIYFHRLPKVSRILGYLQSKEEVQGAPEVGTSHQGAPGPPGAAWWVVPSWGLPPGATKAQLIPSGPLKISVKFRGIWTPFGIDFL